MADLSRLIASLAPFVGDHEEACEFICGVLNTYADYMETNEPWELVDIAALRFASRAINALPDKLMKGVSQCDDSSTQD